MADGYPTHRDNRYFEMSFNPPQQTPKSPSMGSIDPEITAKPPYTSSVSSLHNPNPNFVAGYGGHGGASITNSNHSYGYLPEARQLVNPLPTTTTAAPPTNIHAGAPSYADPVSAVVPSPQMYHTHSVPHQIEHHSSTPVPPSWDVPGQKYVPSYSVPHTGHLSHTNFSNSQGPVAAGSHASGAQRPALTQPYSISSELLPPYPNKPVQQASQTLPQTAGYTSHTFQPVKEIKPDVVRYHKMRNPWAFPITHIDGLTDCTLTNMRLGLFYNGKTHTNTIIELCADIHWNYDDTDNTGIANLDPTLGQYPAAPTNTTYTKPQRYYQIIIQDPKLLKDLGIKMSDRMFAPSSFIRASDTFALYSLQGIRNRGIAVVGSPRHTFMNWKESGEVKESPPEWQEIMQIAAELGRDAYDVHGELVEYMTKTGMVM